jgi:hypothetical protein
MPTRGTHTGAESLNLRGSQGPAGCMLGRAEQAFLGTRFFNPCGSFERFFLDPWLIRVGLRPIKESEGEGSCSSNAMSRVHGPLNHSAGTANMLE